MYQIKVEGKRPRGWPRLMWKNQYKILQTMNLIGDIVQHGKEWKARICVADHILMKHSGKNC